MLNACLAVFFAWVWGNGMKIGKKMKKLHKKGVNMGIGGGTQAAIGMGVLGVAMAAFDHFTGGDQIPNAYPRPAAPSPSYSGSTASAPPPPPPGAQPSSPPPPPPGAANKEQRNQEAIVLIRAAIGRRKRGRINRRGRTPTNTRSI